MHQIVSPIAWTEIKFKVETKTLKEEEKKEIIQIQLFLLKFDEVVTKFVLTK